MTGRGKSKKLRGGGVLQGATAPGVLRTTNRKEASTKLAALPKQYTFTPANALPTANTANLLPAVDTSRAPGVKDYPPPLQLFQTPANVQGASSTGTIDPSPSGAGVTLPPPRQAPPHTPPPRRSSSHPQQNLAGPLQTLSQPPQSLSEARQNRQPHVQATSHSAEATSVQPDSRQSPHSSQAQNCLEGDEETDEDEPEDQVAPIEPTLSEEVLASVNELLSQANREDYCQVLSPLMEPDTSW